MPVLMTWTLLYMDNGGAELPAYKKLGYYEHCGLSSIFYPQKKHLPMFQNFTNKE